MYGDGEQTLDLVHSSDAARANVLAMFNDDVKNEHFNVGTGKETSHLKEVLKLIEKQLGKEGKSKTCRFRSSSCKKKVCINRLKIKKCLDLNRR
jgi:nucleoside-diphosphate-sugar epimerase